MISIYKYYPRALRHYTDFKQEVSLIKDKLMFGKFTFINTTDDGIFTEILLKDTVNKNITIRYYRFGLLKVFTLDDIDERDIQSLFEQFWKLVFKNSVISVTTFQNGVTESLSFLYHQNDITSDVLGFTNSVISVLDEIGNHNRILFKNLENSYKKSPYGKFLKLVRKDAFSTLSVYRSRLKHIKAGINEFKEFNQSKLDDKLKGIISNTYSETEYLENLVELTENFYEKRYTSSQFIKQNRETRIALYSSVIACIVGIIACIAAIYVIPITSSTDKASEKIIDAERQVHIIKPTDKTSSIDSNNLKPIVKRKLPGKMMEKKK